MLSPIESVSHLDGPYQEIAGDQKGEIASRGWSEDATDNGGLITTRDCGGDIYFGGRVVEELNGDPGEGSGSCIPEHLKEWEIEDDLSFTENPRLSWLIGGWKSRDGSPQALWRRMLISPHDVDKEATEGYREKNETGSVNHRIVSLSSESIRSSLQLEHNAGVFFHGNLKGGRTAPIVESQRNGGGFSRG